MGKLNDLIAAQQKGQEDTAVWMVGEQLKEMAAADPKVEELLEQDLAVADMSLAAAEKKIKEYADKHKKGQCAVVPPQVAEKILREFYGLPARDLQESDMPAAPANVVNNIISIEDLL